MERSKLPVLRAPAPVLDLAVPSAKKLCPQKAAPFQSRDPNIAFSSAAPNFVFKGGKNGTKPVVSKKAGPPARGFVGRYRAEAELKEKNQLLEAANNHLHASVTRAQSTMREMSDRQESMKEELEELKRRLEKSMIILESRNIDPVSGEQIVAAAEETSKVREETKTFRENLLTELKSFTAATNDQRELLQTMRTKWDEAEERRRHFLQEREAFQKDLEQFRLSLESTEKMLAV
ncbi:small kinetochore-associated protein [Dendropsophus ebraccatus]|uniref:small kinetochore-associated protein n=1 Tax=Dendropsophus ebraccatus TaxID=150705 RepID=UPI0038321FC6